MHAYSHSKKIRLWKENSLSLNGLQMPSWRNLHLFRFTALYSFFAFFSFFSAGFLCFWCGTAIIRFEAEENEKSMGKSGKTEWEKVYSLSQRQNVFYGKRFWYGEKRCRLAPRSLSQLGAPFDMIFWNGVSLFVGWPRVPPSFVRIPKNTPNQFNLRIEVWSFCLRTLSQT